MEVVAAASAERLRGWRTVDALAHLRSFHLSHTGARCCASPPAAAHHLTNVPRACESIELCECSGCRVILFCGGRIASDSYLGPIPSPPRVGAGNVAEALKAAQAAVAVVAEQRGATVHSNLVLNGSDDPGRKEQWQLTWCLQIAGQHNKAAALIESLLPSEKQIAEAEAGASAEVLEAAHKDAAFAAQILRRMGARRAQTSCTALLHGALLPFCALSLGWRFALYPTVPRWR